MREMDASPDVRVSRDVGRELRLVLLRLGRVADDAERSDANEGAKASREGMNRIDDSTKDILIGQFFMVDVGYFGIRFFPYCLRIPFFVHFLWIFELFACFIFYVASEL